MEFEIEVDGFAGGGGASTGMEEALDRSPFLAVNHWDKAISMHSVNHPATRHLIEDVREVDIAQQCRGRKVGLLWLSPDCTFYSRARGGKPISREGREIRALPWIAQKWARAVRPRVIALENVIELLDWGPLDENDMPIKERKGETWREWKAALEQLGYVVEHRVLTACDYGAPTTRRRLFVIARCDGRPIVWPEPTHGPGRPEPYRTAADVIDFSLPCRSIFERKKPLADPTLRRIAVGLKRYVIDAPRPFLLPFVMNNMTNNVPRPLDAPLATVLTGNHKFLVAPTLVNNFGQSIGRSISEPAPTVVAGAVHAALVAPTLIQTGYGERKGQTPRALDIEAPLGTVVSGGGRHAIVAAWIQKNYGGARESGLRTVGHELARPMSTVTTQDHHSLVAGFLTKLYGTSTAAPADGPVPTVTAGGGHLAAVAALLERWVPGTLPIVWIGGEAWTIVDIGLRMLTPRELFLAQGFPADYRIELDYKGKKLSAKDQIALAGNAVPPQFVTALVRANYTPERTERLAA